LRLGGFINLVILISGGIMVRTGEHLPLPPGTENIATQIVDAAYKVHKALGPGLLENVYEVCFCHELEKHGLSYQRQISVPITYDGITFNEGLRLDVLIEGSVICELKTVDNLNDVHQAQLLTQMKLTGKRLGFLINFNVAVIKYGIKRMIL
jgi:GxxExxY protein